MEDILKCIKCGTFTMKETCACGGKAISTQPAKYSPEFKYQHLRQEARKDELTAKGLL